VIVWTASSASSCQKGQGEAKRREATITGGRDRRTCASIRSSQLLAMKTL
jgi:hypothetical protein